MTVGQPTSSHMNRGSPAALLRVRTHPAQSGTQTGEDDSSSSTHSLYSVDSMGRSESCGLPWRLSCKESACQCRRLKFDLWVWKIPWRRKWQPLPVILPGESHGQRSLAGYSPQVCRRVSHDLASKQQQPIHNLYLSLKLSQYTHQYCVCCTHGGILFFFS